MRIVVLPFFAGMWLTASAALAVTPGTMSYTYDEMGRLKSVTYVTTSGSTTLKTTYTYTYDAAGNRDILGVTTQ